VSSQQFLFYKKFDSFDVVAADSRGLTPVLSPCWDYKDAYSRRA